MLDSIDPTGRATAQDPAPARQVILIGRNITTLRSLLTFALGIVYLSSLFIPLAFLDDVALALMVSVTGLSLLAVRGSSQIISYIAFAVSIALLIAYQAPWEVWRQAIESNLYMVVMFALVPLLRIPIRFGGYYDALQQVFRRIINTRGRFYVFVGSVSAFIGTMVNVAIVPLVYEVSRASPFSKDQRLLSAAMSRGFTTTTIWAPTTASIALIMQLTGSDWLSFVPFGVSAGIVASIVGYTVTRLEDRRRLGAGADPDPDALPALPTAPLDSQDATDRDGYGKFIELCGFTFVLIVIIAIVSFVTGIRTIEVVSMAALLFPVVWMGLLRRLQTLGREFRRTYFAESLPALKSEAALFAAAGFFATTIEHTGLGAYIPEALSALVGQNVFFFTVVVITLALGLALLGVHPIVTVTVIGGTVKAAAFGMSPTYLATVLAICWAIGLSISPSSATIITTSSLTGQSPMTVGARWNGAYALSSAAVLILMITLLRLAGLL